ncbi:hypothetical protein T05_4448 [Trichinella murrelli]|uniref:Uncharacterized protein n=1 Tax=Trichinella murrelli TaxID=144512 RepID=A0A0V0SZA9_9BILA|nr:hypothetical protein T05_4448 [Trichinella murrelli]
MRRNSTQSGVQSKGTPSLTLFSTQRSEVSGEQGMPWA